MNSLQTFAWAGQVNEWNGDQWSYTHRRTVAVTVESHLDFLSYSYKYKRNIFYPHLWLLCAHRVYAVHTMFWMLSWPQTHKSVVYILCLFALESNVV